MHKFGRKPLPTSRQPQTPRTWKIFCQVLLTLKPNEPKTISLGFGAMSEGMILVSLKHDLKLQRCSIHNETLLESLNDIVITIQNNYPRSGVWSSLHLCHRVWNWLLANFGVWRLRELDLSCPIEPLTSHKINEVHYLTVPGTWTKQHSKVYRDRF